MMTTNFGHYLEFFIVVLYFIASKKPALEQRYDEFLKMITEIGKDVKPAYTNSKIHADRLKRSKISLVEGGMVPSGRDYSTKPQWLYCNRCLCL